MDAQMKTTLASSVFRKSFARLTAPVVVTANGHPIGRWIPLVATIEPVSPTGPIPTSPAAREQGPDVPTVVAPIERLAGGHGFGRSRPAPKPGVR